MFVSGSHEQLTSWLELIAAACAVFQVDRSDKRIVLISANCLFEEAVSRPIAESVGSSLDELLPRHVEKQRTQQGFFDPIVAAMHRAMVARRLRHPSMPGFDHRCHQKRRRFTVACARS